MVHGATELSHLVSVLIAFDTCMARKPHKVDLPIAVLELVDDDADVIDDARGIAGSTDTFNRRSTVSADVGVVPTWHVIFEHARVISIPRSSAWVEEQRASVAIRVTAGNDNTRSTVKNSICRASIRVDIDVARDIFEGIMPVISREVVAAADRTLQGLGCKMQ